VFLLFFSRAQCRKKDREAADRQRHEEAAAREKQEKLERERERERKKEEREQRRLERERVHEEAKERRIREEKEAESAAKRAILEKRRLLREQLHNEEHLYLNDRVMSQVRFPTRLELDIDEIFPNAENNEWIPDLPRLKKHFLEEVHMVASGFVCVCVCVCVS
jgi:hypothetical protein